jgi:RND family efflux transporter MFP subunit
MEDAQRDVDRVKHMVEIGGAPQEDLDRAQTRLKTVQAQHSAAQAALKASRASLAHIRDLYAGPIPKRELDDAEGRVEEAKEGVASATQRLQMLLAGPTATQVSVARERVSQAQAKVASAQTPLAYCTLTSPFTGTVVARLKQVGDMAEPKSPILTLAETSQLVVRASLPDRDAVRLRPGTPVVAEIDAASGKPMRLAVERIYPAADSNSRLVTVEIALPNGIQAPPLGSLTRLSFLATEHRKAIVIPSAAVLEHPGGKRVAFVVAKSGKADMREITVGIEQNDRIEALSGIEPGEQLVVRGQEALKDGMAIKIMPPKPNASGGPQAKGRRGESPSTPGSRSGQPSGEAKR